MFIIIIFLEREIDDTDDAPPKSKRINCDKCDETFENKWKLRSHLKTHNSNYCEICNIEYTLR